MKLSKKRLTYEEKKAQNEKWDQKTAAELIAEFGKQWDYEECYKYPVLNNFDRLTKKACELADKFSSDKEIEEAWLKILLMLDESISQVMPSLNEDFNQTNKQRKDNLGQDNEMMAALVKDFILRRKNAIAMYNVPMTVSPITIIDKLNLDLKSVRMIFEYRTKAIKNEKKLMKIVNQMMIKEKLLESLIISQENLQGFMLEPDPETATQKMIAS